MKIHHLALRTRDLPGLLGFYTNVLQLVVVPKRAEVAAGGGHPTPALAASIWLQAGDTLVMLEPAEEGEPEVAPGTRDLLAFAITPDEKAPFEARLAQHGIAIEARTAFTLYFRDPDGRRVAVSHYPDN